MGIFDFLKKNKGARKGTDAAELRGPVSEMEFAKSVVLEDFADMFGDEEPEEITVHDLQGRQIGTL